LRSPGRPGVAQRADRRRFWAAVLGGDCGGFVERGRGGWCWGIAGGRGVMVSGGGRHATINACAMVEAPDRAIPVVCGAGGACDPARAGACRAGACGAGAVGAGACGADDLAGAAAQRRHPQRRPGVSGHDGAVTRRAGRPPPEGGEAGDQRGAAALRGGAACRRRCRPGWGRTSWAVRALEGLPARAAAGPAVGCGVEPAADCPSLAAGFPR